MTRRKESENQKALRQLNRGTKKAITNIGEFSKHINKLEKRAKKGDQIANLQLGCIYFIIFAISILFLIASFLSQ